MARKTAAAAELFAVKGADNVYAAIMAGLNKRLGAHKAVEEVKQTCVHVVAGKGGTAYAGLHPRKGAVLLNIRLAAPLKSPRIRKVEQISRNRFDHEMIVSSPDDLDDQVLGWLEAAWQVAAQGRRTRSGKSANASG